MLSGVVSNDNLAEVLRGISQKRKQGILEITIGDRPLQLLFVAGKIVDAYETAPGAVQEVIATIGAAGVLPDTFECTANRYGELFDALESAGCPLDLDEFKVVIAQRVLGVLYGLTVRSGAYYNFKVQMVEYEQELCPAISVGNLLLDLVALEDDEGRFTEAFPPDYFVIVDEQIDSASIEEGFLLHALESHRYVTELQAASMLSEFHFREALFSLLSRGVISVQPEGVLPETEESCSLEDIVATLEGSFEHDLPLAGLESAFDDVSDIQDSTPGRGELSEAHTAAPEEAAMQVSFPGILNARLLQAAWVPGVLVILFLFSALFAPVLAWDSCIRAFSAF